MLEKIKGMFGGSKVIDIASPVAGTVIPLAEVPDPTFAAEILGKGVAVIPSEGCISAPADGTIDVMFNTGHAVSMTTVDGVEILIHVGIDTVKLNGAHYKACTNAGDKVARGQVLIEFNLEAIRAAGYETVTPLIVCNTGAYAAVKTAKIGAVSTSDTLLRIEKK